MSDHSTDSEGGDRRRRQHDPERIRRGVENLRRVLSDHEWRWSRQSREFLEKLGRVEGGAERAVAAEAERDALADAQELIYEAWEAPAKRRTALAHAALEICRDCADAYVLLGDAADTLEEACNFYRRGVAAGERALGLDAFVHHRGHFWSRLETRPFMRAKLSLADCLCRLGEYDEALKHFEELLVLNPNDNQGVRYWYAQCLFAIDDGEGLQYLLDRYAWDVTAPWTYARALHAYRTRGPERALHALERAVASNPHVPDFLLGTKDLPEELPDYVGIGSEEEAAAVAEALYEAWDETPGALTWLREATHRRAEGAPPSTP